METALCFATLVHSSTSKQIEMDSRDFQDERCRKIIRKNRAVTTFGIFFHVHQDSLPIPVG
jgi:hypothetical protein